MATTTSDLASQWKALNPQQRDLAMSRMSSDQKRKLATVLGYKGDGVPATAPSGIARFLSSAEAPFIGAVKGLDPRPTEEEKKQGLTSAYDYVARPFERVVESAEDQGIQALAALKKSNPLSLHPTPDQVSERELALGHGLATVLPVVGPWAANTGEKLGKELGTGDYAGAAGTALGNAALALAPKAAGKAADIAKDRVTNVGAAPRTIGDLIGKKQDLNAKAEESHLNDAQDAVEKRRNERRKAIQKNRESGAEHQAKTEQVRAENKQAVKQQNDRAATEEKLKSATGELQAQIETARNNALKVGNEKYSMVNKALDGVEADPEFANDAYEAATDKMKGSDAEPTIVKNFGKRIDSGDILTYRDLQGFYSELGTELVKGTLPGDVFTALNTLHESIGDEMQRIADSKGQGAQLADARNYWRRMKQTFGKPYNPNDVATATMEKVSPEVAREAEQQNRLRLLGSFDESIPQTAEHISNLRKGLSSLPKERPLREILKPKPATVNRVPVPRMEEAPVPERPTPKKVNSEDIVKAKEERLKDATNHIRRWGVYLGFVWPAIETVRKVMGGEAPDITSTAGSMIVTPLAADGIARIIESPKMKYLMTRATPKEIAQIPPDLRGDLPAIAEAAKKRGIAISPAMQSAVLVGSSGRKRVAAALQP